MTMFNAHIVTDADAPTVALENEHDTWRMSPVEARDLAADLVEAADLADLAAVIADEDAQAERAGESVADEATGPADDNDSPGTVDGEAGICRRCGQDIIWEFDSPDDRHGFWYATERPGVGEVCLPGPDDANRYHAPATDPLNLDPEDFDGADVADLVDLGGLAPETRRVMVLAEHRQSCDGPATFGPFVTAAAAREWAIGQYRSGEFDPHGCEVRFTRAE